MRKLFEDVHLMEGDGPDIFIVQRAFVVPTQFGTGKHLFGPRDWLEVNDLGDGFNVGVYLDRIGTELIVPRHEFVRWNKEGWVNQAKALDTTKSLGYGWYLKEEEEDEEEFIDLNEPMAPEEVEQSPQRSMGMTEDFNIGKSVEWRKSKNKWSLSERTLNAVVGRLNTDYHVWKEKIKWYQERNGRWNLYVKDPMGMDKYIQQIERDIKAYDL